METTTTTTNHPRPYGLRDRIRSASSPDVIAILLDEGRTYQEASFKTKRSWQYAAKRRLAELGK